MKKFKKWITVGFDAFGFIILIIALVTIFIILPEMLTTPPK